MLTTDELLYKLYSERMVDAMAVTNLNIRTDKDIKDKADQIFTELGLNMTTAINMFLRTAVREKGIPFTLKLDVQDDGSKAE